MIGESKAHIVVAHALKLNGAMIANAEVDENGQFTDHGHLTLKVGELFVQHIYDYDNGHTLGLSVGVADKLKEFVARPEFGVHNGAGKTYSTVGQGEVVCVGDICEVGQANRDVSKPQTFESNYDIETIKGYITNFDAEEAKRNIPRDASGKIDFGAIVGGYFGDIYNQFAEIFGGDARQAEEQDQVESKEEKANEKARVKKQEELESLDREIMKLASAVIGDSDAKRLAVFGLVYSLKKGGMDTVDAVGLALEAVLKAEQALGDLAVLEPAAFPIVIGAAEGIGAVAASCGRSPACMAMATGIAKLAGDMLSKAGVGGNGSPGLFERDDSDSDIVLEKRRNGDKSKNIVKDVAGAGASTGMPDPDGDDDNGRKINPHKAESKIWQELKPYRDKIKTNGLSGKKQRFYHWDELHNEIEMYDSRGNPIDAIDPRTGERLFKDISKHKPLKL